VLAAAVAVSWAAPPPRPVVPIAFSVMVSAALCATRCDGAEACGSDGAHCIPRAQSPPLDRERVPVTPVPLQFNLTAELVTHEQRQVLMEVISTSDASKTTISCVSRAAWCRRSCVPLSSSLAVSVCRCDCLAVCPQRPDGGVPGVAHRWR
jgi:hypothetical protein